MKRTHTFSLILLFSLLLTRFTISSQIKIQPDLNHVQQKWEGWGVSLAWWANVMGGWNDAQVNELVSWMADSSELNLNVFRFNIGGGDNPAHTHIRKDGGAMPGYKKDASSGFDWNADANQRNILLRLNKLRKDAIFDASSYSPPYWMTISGCSSGNTDGKDNLKETCYDEYADYLTEIIAHYKDTYGIRFNLLSAMNEPYSDWWKANGTQEGCAFSGDNQLKLIRTLYRHLQQKNMLGYCSLSAMDANSIDECEAGYRAYMSYPEILQMISQINTHSYFGTHRAELASLAEQTKKHIWQSESGPLNREERGMENYLLMAQRIISDIKELKPVVWCDWQFAAEKDDIWGMVVYDQENKTYRKGKSFYMRQQFSRFIKPGYYILDIPGENILAAVNSDRSELVIVIVNAAGTEIPYAIDLKKSNASGINVMAYRSSENENCKPITIETQPGITGIAFVTEPKSLNTLVFKLK